MEGAAPIVWLILTLTLFVAPHKMELAPSHTLVLNLCGGLLFALGLLSWVFLQLFRKTTADRAFYRTGLGLAQAVIDGGAIVIPTLHAVQVVTLRSIAIDMQRGGAKGVRCKDKLRADLKIKVFVRVAKTEEGVRLAATLFGEDADDAEAIKAHVDPHVVAAVNTVAAALTVVAIQTDRERFTKQIHELITPSIEAYGLRVETVTLTEFDQGDPKHLNPANTLDAKALELLWDDARNAAKAKEGLLTSDKS